MFGKPLAYIVKIKDIREIPGADEIELATVLDYTVVVKKNEYKPDDLGLYIEVDSVLPDGFSEVQKQLYDSIKDGSYFKGITTTDEEVKLAREGLARSSRWPYFEFLRDKNFKIKNMKLNKFGVVSQGILFKPEDVGLTNVKVGQDFTSHFEITEIVQDNEEAGLNQKRESWLEHKLLKFSWYKNWRKRHNVAEVWDASFPEKSDETNVQRVYSEMYEKYADKEWVATEKLEGQNISIYSEETRSWFGRRSKRIGVCSRTRKLNKNSSNGSIFWETVNRLGLEKKIKNIPGEWWCRGEHVGPKIQNNIYKLTSTDIVFFDFYKKEYDLVNKKKFKWVKLNFEESIEFAEKYNLKFVPILDEHYKLPASSVNDKGVKVSGADIMLQQSDKNTVFGNNLKHKREGFVLRLRDDYNVSFKVKNPNYSYTN